jgi:hypothetical protein
MYLVGVLSRVIEEPPERVAYGEGSPIRSRGRVSDRQTFEPRRLTLPACIPSHTNLVVGCGLYRPAGKDSSVESVPQ